MKRKKKVLLIIAGALVLLAAVSLLVWRLVPRSLGTVLSASPEELQRFAGTVIIAGIEDAEPYHEVFSLEADSPDDPVLQELLRRLDATGYRPDLRNLLPFARRSVSLEGGDYSIHLVFTDKTAGYFLSFHGEGLVSVSTPEQDGYRTYHPSDPAAVEELRDFLIENAAAD